MCTVFSLKQRTLWVLTHEIVKIITFQTNFSCWQSQWDIIIRLAKDFRLQCRVLLFFCLLVYLCVPAWIQTPFGLTAIWNWQEIVTFQTDFSVDDLNETLFKRTPMTFEVDNEVTTYREITRIQFHFYLLRICAHNCLIIVLLVEP